MGEEKDEEAVLESMLRAGTVDYAEVLSENRVEEQEQPVMAREITPQEEPRSFSQLALARKQELKQSE